MELAQSAVGKLNVKLHNSDLAGWQKSQMEKELRLQTNAILYWTTEFRRLGGGDQMIMPIDNLFAKSKSAEEIHAASMEQMQAKNAAAKKAANEAAFREQVNRLEKCPDVPRRSLRYAAGKQRSTKCTRARPGWSICSAAAR